MFSGTPFYSAISILGKKNLIAEQLLTLGYFNWQSNNRGMAAPPAQIFMPPVNLPSPKGLVMNDNIATIGKHGRRCGQDTKLPQEILNRSHW